MKNFMKILFAGVLAAGFALAQENRGAPDPEKTQRPEKMAMGDCPCCKSAQAKKQKKARKTDAAKNDSTAPAANGMQCGKMACCKHAD